MSRQFTGHRALLTKVVAFTVQHGALTHDRMRSPEVVAVFTERELTALRECCPALRGPAVSPQTHSRFAYPVMAVRDVLIAIDDLNYSAGEPELTKTRSDFRRAAVSMLAELAVAGARTTQTVDCPTTVPLGSEPDMPKSMPKNNASAVSKDQRPRVSAMMTRE